MFKFDALPQLATGTHSEGSGQACIMNAISYLTGQVNISDLPNCVWGPLARAAQGLNDAICQPDHNGYAQFETSPGEPQNLLCPSCTHKMWMIGHQLIGSAEAFRDANTAPNGLPIKMLVSQMLIAGLDEISKLWKRGPGTETIAFYIRFLKGYENDVEEYYRYIQGESYYHKTVQRWPVLEAVDHCVRTSMEGFINPTRFGSDPEDGSYYYARAMSYLLMTPLSAQIKIDVMQAMINRFNDLTGHTPMRPREADIELARLRAGLVMV